MHKDGVAFPALSEPARSVLIELLVHGPASRADLARRANLSPASLTRIIRGFIDDDLVTESAVTSTQRTGRPSQPMDVNVDVAHLIGIKLLPDALHVVTTDLRARVLTQRRLPLASKHPDAVTEAITAVVDTSSRADPLLRAVGVSLAGPVPPGSEVVPTSPFLDWVDVPLVPMLRESTGLPTVVANDVRALTAAEHWFGMATGCSDFALVTIGAGIGCAIVADDRLVHGVNGGSGHVGHIPVTPGGPLCERGHRGCVRSYLSSASIVSQVSVALGRAVGYEEVLTLAITGNPVARRVVEDAGRALGILIGTIAALSAPAKVIVSGEGVGLASIVIDTVVQHARVAQHWALPEVPIQIAPFTFTEWARGAAVMALRHIIDSSKTVQT